VIKKIVEFMDANEEIEEYFIQNEVSNSYLHYYIKINNNMVCRDLLDIDNLDSELKKTLKYMTYYQKGMHNKYLDKNKGLGGSSPYILSVKVLYDINDENEIIKTSLYNLKPTKNGITSNRIKVQFESARAYLEKDEDKEKLSSIQKYLEENLETILLTKKSIIQELKEKYDKQKKKKEVSVEIRVYIDVGLDIVKSFYEKFVEKRAFLDTKKAGLHKGQCSICNQESDELSLPYVLSTLGDSLGMKLTMPMKLTNHVCKTCTLKLHKFKVMTDNQQLTKPFPLFIDKKNLFGEQEKILKDNEKKKSYREIIKSIYYKNPKDLKNFYLLNYYSKSDNGWKLQIKDLDYIENFEYMTTFKIENFLQMKNSFRLNDFYDKKLSVFQFEKILNELIFDKKLIDKQFHYFKDYKEIKITYWKIDSSNSNSILKNYLIKYRQNIYDYIYKSHQSAFTLIDFREMLLDIIIDDIRHDDKNKDGYSIYENEIKEKLNLLFSLNQNKETKLDSGEFIKLKIKMRDSLGYWQDSLELKADGKTFKKEFIGGVEFIEDDRLYAFLCGQLARFLIGKKKGKDENKSHADFSGFTEWQTSKLLKSYIWEIHRKYAHELKFDKKYDNAMSMIMSYRDDLQIEDMMEYMIAGYFSDNQIQYQNNNLEESENE
jgi:CRISPR-associated protein Csh1